MLEHRLSTAVVRRIYDDNNDGVADATPLEQLVIDAEARFESYCRGIYILSALRDSPPNEAKRLCLDVAEAMACRRFPRAVNREWQPLWEASERELKSLRRGETRLDVEGTPEPAANEGGAVYKNGEDVGFSEEYTPFFMNGTGLF